MAEYRLSYKKGKKGFAHNHAAYIMRENGYKGKEDLIYKESGNMPLFVDGNNALDFWAAADLYEYEDRNTYREFELNIPNELNYKQARQLIQNFVKKELVNEPYSFAIHDEKKDGARNLHCHLMFSERSLDGIERPKDIYFKNARSKNPEKGGAKKNIYFKQADNVIKFRKSWEEEQNKILKELKLNVKVDCRSLEDRRKEATENNDIALAESLNRNPVNISKKIANIVKYQGEEKLNPLDKEKYNNFKANRIKKYSNERLLEIKKGNIIPTENECKKRLEFLEKKDIDLIAINIITKGEYKRLEDRINNIKIDFNDIDMFKRKRIELETRKKELVKESKESSKYKSLMFFLKQDLEQEKQIYNTILEKEYSDKIKETETKDNIKELYTNDEKLYKKYSQYSIDKLDFRLKEIEHEEPQKRAEAIITNYRRESLISNYILYKDELRNIEQRKLAQEALNTDTTVVKKQIESIKENLNFIDLEYENLNKKIIENQGKINDLTNNLIEQNNKEKLVINKLIMEKTKDTPLGIREVLKNSIKIETEYIKTQRTFEYFSKNNKTEKYNKALYNINKKLEILGKEKGIYQKKTSSVDKKEINDILIRIRKENKNILEMSKIKLEKLEKAKKHLDLIKEDNVIKKLTINKMTKGAFIKGIKDKINLSNEIKILNTEFGNLGKFDFMKKNKISSEISKKTELYNGYLEKEKSMITIIEKNPNYDKKFKEIVKNIEQAQKNINNQIIQEKKTINEKSAELKVISNTNKKDNKNTKSQKLQQVKSTGVDKNNTSLGKIISQIEQENNNLGQNNLDLNLEEEKICTL